MKPYFIRCPLNCVDKDGHIISSPLVNLNHVAFIEASSEEVGSNDFPYIITFYFANDSCGSSSYVEWKFKTMSRRDQVFEKINQLDILNEK